MTLKNILLSICGFLLLGIAFVGCFVPILPTTPFILLSTACFTGNPKVRSWILKNKFFSEHLTNYKERTGLKKSTVILSLSFLWAMLFLSMLAMKTFWGTFLLCFVGIAVTIHIVMIAQPKKYKSDV